MNMMLILINMHLMLYLFMELDLKSFKTAH